MKVKICQKTVTTNGIKEVLYGLKDQDNKIVLTPQFDKIHDFSLTGKFVHVSRKGEFFMWQVKEGDPAGTDITAETLVQYPSAGRIHFPYNRDGMYYRTRSGKVVIFYGESLVPLCVHGNVTGINFLKEWVVVPYAGKYYLYDPAGNHVDSYRYPPYEALYDSNLFLFRKNKRSEGLGDIVKIEGDKRTTLAAIDAYCRNGFDESEKVLFYKPFNEKYWKAIGESSGCINLLVKFKFTHLKESGGFVVGLNGKKFTVLKQKASIFEKLSEVEINGYSEEELDNYQIHYTSMCPTLSVKLPKSGASEKILFSFTTKDGKIAVPDKLLNNAAKVGLAFESGYSVWLIEDKRQLIIVDANMKEIVREFIPVDCEVEDFIPSGDFYFRSLVNETKTYIIVQNNPSTRTLIVNKTTGVCVWYGKWVSTANIGEINPSNIHYGSDTLLNRKEGCLIELADGKCSDKIVHIPNYFSSFSFSRELGMVRFSGYNGEFIIKVDMISRIFPQKD